MATYAKQGITVLAMLVMAATATPARAQQAPSVEALERTFWRCDHASTQGTLDSGSAMQCSVATEALKQRRFNGDFAAMLVWWKANKEAQHLALTAAPAQRVARAAP